MSDTHSATPPSSLSALSLRDLSKSYGKHQAVKSLTLDVFEGDIFGFLGPNGAGKSTTMAMIAGLVKPTSGTVEIFGVPHNSGPEARRPLGTMLENIGFYDYLSARKNLELLSSIYGNIPKTRPDEVLDRVGLLPRANDKVRNYSHGMKQRLGIAQALLASPRLMILDEPTNGLDPEAGVQIWKLLRNLAKQENITIFISSHLLHEVEEGCNRIGVINQGILVACDEVRNLLFFHREEILLHFDSAVQCDAARDVLQKFSGVEIVTENIADTGAFRLPIVEETEAAKDAGLYSIRLRLRQELASDVVRHLAEKGVAPRSVVPQRKTLKQFFFDLTRRQN